MSPAFNPEASVTINASPDIVFELLCNRAAWGEWNTFVPHAELVKPQPGGATDESHLQVGQLLRVDVQDERDGQLVPGAAKSLEEITALTTPTDPAAADAVWTVEWQQRQIPEFFVRTLRNNEVRREGTGCVYWTKITFTGLLVPAVKWKMGAMVQNGLDRCVRDLKEAAERKQAGNTPAPQHGEAPTA